MIALVQRVSEASVTAQGSISGAIDAGLLIFVAIHQDDTEREVTWMANRCARLRIFPDEHGRMNRSLLDTGGDALVVSQFTLYGDVRKGNRPAFSQAAPAKKANALYQEFIEHLSQALGRPVAKGVFGAAMQVRLCNEGPVTILIDRKPGLRPRKKNNSS